VNVPANTEATLFLPTTDPAGIVESGISPAKAEGVAGAGVVPGAALFRLVSGMYNFDSPFDLSKWTEINRIPFAFMPRVTPSESVFRLPSLGAVEIQSETPGAHVRYTLDGSDPTEQSLEYKGPVRIAKATVLKAKAFKDGLKPSVTATAMYDVVDPSVNGLSVQYYEGEGWQKIPDFDKLVPVSKGSVTAFDLASIKKRQNQWGVRFSAYLNLVAKGDYTFGLMSDDGSRLMIDGKTIIDNDGSHGAMEKSGTVALAPGAHRLVLDYFNDTDGELLNVAIEGPGIGRRPLPVSMLSLVPDKNVEMDKK
jgi:hypothetical protein